MKSAWLIAILLALNSPLAAQAPDSVRHVPVSRSVTVDSVVVYRTRVSGDTAPPVDTLPTPLGSATSVTLTPADTLRLQVGKTGDFMAQAFNAGQAVGTPIRWYMSGSIGAISPLSCISPCRATVIARSVGLARIIIHEYRSSSLAPPDTAFVRITP